ncbi:MAG: GNAT family N-acetyltransferase, partial [Spirochaetaceae bacterium]|nr:GNAT family N-acetyltransferase [Spirochaetaceae bacterium]
MKTKRLNLKVVEPKDAKLIATWKNNSHIELEEQAIINNHAPYYMLTITETNEPIGYIRIQWMNEDKTSAILKFHLGLYKGQGYMKEALETFIPTLFEQGV